MDRIGIKQDEDMWYGMTIRLRNFAARVSAATRSFGQWAGVALLLVLSFLGVGGGIISRGMMAVYGVFVTLIFG